MKKAAKSAMYERKMAKLDPMFMRIINAFAADRQVTHGGGKGFGSDALKVKDKIFAMISSKGEFVVKLPKKRVDALVENGKGERFDPGHGRLMKEWVVIGPEKSDWVIFAKEACAFVKQAK